MKVFRIKGVGGEGEWLGYIFIWTKKRTMLDEEGEGEGNFRFVDSFGVRVGDEIVELIVFFYEVVFV